MHQQEKTFCKTCKTETHLYLLLRYYGISKYKEHYTHKDFLATKLKNNIIITKYYGKIFSEEELRLQQENILSFLIYHMRICTI